MVFGNMGESLVIGVVFICNLFIGEWVFYGEFFVNV